MRLIALALLPALVFGQTVVNGGRTFLGTVDAGSATWTRPLKTGTSLPATCGVGEMYFKSDATAGSNLYGCTATNTWTAISGSGGGGSTIYGTYAGLASHTCNGAAEGTIYFFTDSAYSHAICASSNWDHYVPIFGKVTLPPATGWTAINVTSSTFTSTYGGLTFTNNDNTTNLSGEVRAVPGTTSTITAVLAMTGLSTASGTIAGGVCLSNGSANTNAYLMFGTYLNPSGFQNNLFVDSANNWQNSGAVRRATGSSIRPAYVRLRTVVDGSTIYFRLSALSGETFVELTTLSIASYFTPTHWGICSKAATSGPLIIQLLGYEAI